MSLNLGQGHKALLNCGALWWTQQPPGAEHCRDLTRSLINDCILLLPPTDNPMPLIPSKSPLLAGILLTYFSDIYPLPEMNRSFVAPPVELVRIAFCWLKDNLELTGAQPSETQGVVPMLGRIYKIYRLQIFWVIQKSIRDVKKNRFLFVNLGLVYKDMKKRERCT